jgi:hypothetical protein
MVTLFNHGGPVKIYLDDERVAPNDWVHTHTAKQTIALLENGVVVTHLSLDHDLGDEKEVGTGYDVLLWMEEEVYTNRYYLPPPTITVHSANSGARPKMESAIESIKNRFNMNIMWTEEEGTVDEDWGSVGTVRDPACPVCGDRKVVANTFGEDEIEYEACGVCSPSSESS